MKTLKKSVSLTAIFVVVVVINLMSMKVETAYASMSNLSFGPSGSTVGTFFHSDETIATFQISPGVAATGYYICTVMPSGTVLNIGNTATADFIVEQNGGPVGPSSLNTSWWLSSRTICLGMSSALDADNIITVRMSGSASGDEIQLPVAATNSGTFSINAPYLGDLLSISNVSLIPDVATQILVETKADGTGTVVPEQRLWSGDSLTAYSNTRDQYDNFVANVAATWSLQGKTGGVADGDLVPNGDNKNAIFTGDGEGTTAIRAVSGGLTAIDSETITVEEEFCGDGDGTELSPYGVCDWNNLYNVRNHLTTHFILMNDLNEDSVGYAAYAGSTANAGAGWEPIGTQAVKFTGSFDGDGFTISNLYINRLAEDFLGLFGCTNGVDLNSIILEDVSIVGNNYVGGLVGYSYGSSISSSSSSGDIDGNDYTGGLVGGNSSDSTILKSYSTGSVSGRDYVGGFVGDNFHGSISESYSDASVSGRDYVGGLVSYNNSGADSISNSYSRGSVSGNFYVGGLVGYNSTEATVSNSYSTGSVSGSSSVGGLNGSAAIGSINNSFWDTDTSAQVSSSGGTGKTTAEMKTAITFTGATWNFENIWARGGGRNNGYPYLQSLPPEIVTYTLTYTAGDNGSITGDSPQTVLDGGDGTAITAAPDTGYSFVEWNDHSTSASRTDTNITANTTYTATFAINTYTLSYTAGTGGSLTGSSSQTVDYGSDGSAITVVADVGYAFSRWSDGITANPRTDTGISGNISVSAVFTANSSGAFAPPSVPKVVVPPSFSNGSINSSVSNAYQMAVSDSEDFSGSSWQDYDESYKTSGKILYVKFRSKDGGVSEVYKVGGSQMATGNQYEGKLVKYANLPKVFKIEDNKKRWIVSEEAFNYYRYNWQDIISVTEEFADGENIVKPTILSGFYKFTRNLKQGDTGEDVRELQKYLNSKGFALSPAGQPGSSGNETTVFGNATKNALIRFQQAVNLPTYGYFGSMTINVINNR